MTSLTKIWAKPVLGNFHVNHEESLPESQEDFLFDTCLSPHAVARNYLIVRSDWFLNQSEDSRLSPPKEDTQDVCIRNVFLRERICHAEQHAQDLTSGLSATPSAFNSLATLAPSSALSARLARKSSSENATKRG